MSADKRNFEKFDDIQGKLDIPTGCWEFPTVYTTDKTGHSRVWQIKVRLIKTASRQDYTTINWNLLGEDTVPVHPDYLVGGATLPKGVIAQYWTEAGCVGGTITRSAPTYTTEKNVGRANFRDTFKTALVEARGKYLKKLDKGGSVDEDQAIDTSSQKVLPMLAHNWNMYTNKKWPVYVQPKLDGVRCLMYWDGHQVVMYTRTRKEYPHNPSNDAVREAVRPLLLKNKGMYLDGELYNHTLRLQDISHLTRSGAGGSEEVDYWIYDIIIPSLVFSERTRMLRRMYITGCGSRIHFTPTHLVTDLTELNDYYNKFLNDGYEGMMVREVDGTYGIGTRSRNLLKRKEVFTNEFEVVGFTQGTGRDVGAVIWKCCTTEGLSFNVVQNGTYEERYKMFKECEENFTDKYANRLITVEYRGLSEDNVPQHGRAIHFRDE